MTTTLESRYDQRVRELEASRDKAGKVCDAEVEYILDTMPFIREYTSTQDATHPVAQSKRGIDSFVTVKHKNNRNSVFQQYLVEVEKNVEAAQAIPLGAMRAHDDVMTCQRCNHPFVFNSRESELVCTSCGTSQSHMVMSEQNLTFDQEVQQTSVINYFSYKRLNHFTEWLNSLQAKENTEIPTEVIEAVRAEFRKERASKRADVKPSKVRAFLKKLKMNKVSDGIGVFILAHLGFSDATVAMVTQGTFPVHPPPLHVRRGTSILKPSATRSTACLRPSCPSTWRTS